MTYSFTVRVDVDPQALPRVIGQLARRWIVPDRLCAEQVGDELVIDFVTSDLSDPVAELVGATLRSCVLVKDVVVTPMTTGG